MFVSRLGTKNFRNLQDCQVFPARGVNVIYGGNAQGKTNLLEALWLFTGGHSFRGAKDSELPRIGSSSASLALDFFSQEREQKAVLNIENGRRNSVINGVAKKTGSALIGKLCAVIFSPEHLLLVKEGPGRRRGFIDGALCQKKPKYAPLLSTYNRTLAQRNALLKDISRYPELGDTLEVWDARLSQLGARVMEERRDYVKVLGPQASQVYMGISRGKEPLELFYEPSLKELSGEFTREEAEACFFQELQKGRSADLRAGFTLSGPHRDDLELVLDGISARTYGSQGQQRSTVLALKLSEAQLLSDSLGETPIVLLDDVMSELDRDRQDYLLNHLHGRQVFITCCSPESVDLLEAGKRLRLEAGQVFSE